MATFKVVLKSNGSVRVVKSDGKDASEFEIEEIITELTNRRQSYIYIAGGHHKKTGEYIYKIGVSDYPDTRLAGLRFSPIHYLECSRADRLFYEQQVHGWYMEQGKWIEREYFALSKDDLADIKAFTAAKDFCKAHKPEMYWASSYHSIVRTELAGYYAEMVKRGHTTMIETYRELRAENAARHQEIAQARKTGDWSRLMRKLEEAS